MNRRGARSARKAQPDLCHGTAILRVRGQVNLHVADTPVTLNLERHNYRRSRLRAPGLFGPPLSPIPCIKTVVRLQEKLC